MNELVTLTVAVLLVWFGIAAYLFTLGRRISKIEKIAKVKEE